VVLVVAGLKVRVSVNGLHLPLGVLECHFFVFLLLRIHLLFTFPLVRRRALLAQLLLFLMELLCELLDLLTPTHVVARRVMHQAFGAAVITAGCLTGALVASWASASTCHYSCSCGGAS
jgi:hypothetical protein